MGSSSSVTSKSIVVIAIMPSECGVTVDKGTLSKVLYVVDEKGDMPRQLLQSVNVALLRNR
jgi:hypothetical protein